MGGTEVLGETDLTADQAVDHILALRQQMRAAKMWEQSDEVRDALLDLGVVIEDSQEGATWRWK